MITAAPTFVHSSETVQPARSRALVAKSRLRPLVLILACLGLSLASGCYDGPSFCDSLCNDALDCGSKSLGEF